MTPERWQQIDQLFCAALEREPDERAAFLDQACDGDAELRQEVESLLAAEAETEHTTKALPAQIAAQIAAEMLVDDQAKKIIGRQISHYRILSPLGKGGMGEVFLAQDTNLKRQVALKLLPRPFTAVAERVQRFEREARTASALNHPNILTIHEIGKVDETHFIVTEYVEGNTLRQRMSAARLSLSDALEIALQIANALAAAHQAGIIHRDIKPENVMVREDGLVKVLDFGLAKLIELRNADCGMRNEEEETLRQGEPNNPRSEIRIPQSTLPGMSSRCAGDFRWRERLPWRGLSSVVFGT
jgi:serine/threonine protein kinase